MFDKSKALASAKGSLFTCLAAFLISMVANAAWANVPGEEPSPGSVAIISETRAFAEDSGAATLVVARVDGSDGVLTAEYLTTPGTASAGSDYSSTAGTLSWADGDTSPRTITISLVTDTVPEPDETFSVQVGSLDPAVLTILNDDAAGTAGTIDMTSAALTVSEADGSVTVSAVRTGGVDGPLSVTLTTVNGSATSGEDYAAQSVTLSWADQEGGARSVSIPIVDDNVVETDETFSVSLSGANVGSSTTTEVTITDDDVAGTVEMASAALTVSEADGSVTVSAVRTGGVDGPLSVTLTTANGSATSGEDYTAQSVTLSWADQEGGTLSVSIPIVDDNVVETDETFSVSLSGANVGSSATTEVTITDDDVAGTVEMASAALTVSEADGSVTVSAVRTGGVDGPLSVTLTTANGSATSGEDYTAQSVTLSWADQEDGTQSVSIPIVDDNVVETDETFSVSLSGANVGSSTTTEVTITDDDVAGTVEMASAALTVSEADGSVTVSAVRTGGVSGPLSVTLTTVNGSATSGEDYAAQSVTLSWADQEGGTQSVSIPIVDDNVVETDETFSVSLSGTNVGSSTTTEVTITDDDVAGTVEMASAALTVSEADGSVTVSAVRTGGVDGPISVTLTTTDGSAASGEDYTAQSVTLSWADQEGGAQSVSIPIVDDNVVETDETFSVSLSGANAGSSVTTEVTITDDDIAGAIEFADSAVTVDEDAGTVELTVIRVGGIDGPLSIDYATADGTAFAGEDYTAQSGELSWGDQDATPQVITLAIANDNLIEPDETFDVALSGTAVGGTSSSSVTIIDDDMAGSVQFADATVSVSEDDTVATLTLTREDGIDGSLSVRFTTADGTATAGNDYVAQAGDITWDDQDGDPRTISIALNDDGVIEEDETFSVIVSNPSDSSETTAVVTIVNDDTGPVLSVETLTLSGRQGDTVTGEFAVDTTLDVTTSAGGGTTSPAQLSSPGGTVTYSFAIPGTAAAGSTLSDTVIVTDSAGNESSVDVSVDVRAAEGGEISVTQSVLRVEEDDGQVFIEVTRSGGTQGAAAVSFATVAGSATAGTDFTPASGTVAWADGEAGSRTIAVDILTDEVSPESPETFSVQLTLSPSTEFATLGAASSAEVTILNTARVVTVDPVTLVTQATPGSTVSEEITVGGEPPVNLSAAEGAVTPDTISQSSATVTYTRVVPTDATPGDTLLDTITITDAEGDVETVSVEIQVIAAPSTIEFSASDFSVNEADESVTLTVVRSGVATGAVAVGFSTADGTAESPADYDAVSGTLNWADGELGAQSITLSIVNDTELEGRETVAVNLTSVEGLVSLGAVNSTTVSIRDAARDTTEIPNLTPNQRRMAEWVDNTCPRLGDLASPDADQADLYSTCAGIRDPRLTDGEVINALDQISYQEISAAYISALRLTAAKHGNLSQRLNGLRNGATGIDISGLNLSIGNQQISGQALATMLEETFGIGGGASADDGGFVSGRWGAFVNGNIKTGEYDETRNQGGFEFDSILVTAGVDYRLKPNLIIGGALGYAQVDADYDRNRGGLDVDSWSASLFGTYYKDEAYYVDSILSYGTNDYDSIRRINFSTPFETVDRTARGSSDGKQFSFAVSGGYDFNRGALTFGPNIGTEYIDVQVDSIRERGAGGLDLVVGEQNAQSLTVNAGLHASYAITLNWGVVVPQARVDAIHEFKNDQELIGIRFAADPFANDPSNPSPAIAIATDDPDQDYLLWSVGLHFQFINGFAGFVNYQSITGYSGMEMDDISFGLRYEKIF